MKHVAIGGGIAIPADRAHRVESAITIEGVRGLLRSVAVRCALEHADPRDLRLKLRAPWGETVDLANRRGRAVAGETLFADDAPADVRGAGASLSGSWRPEQALSTLRDKPVEGTWSLLVEDVRAGRGGHLHWWQLELETSAGAFSIEIDVLGGLTATQRAVFERASERWSEVIVGDLPDAQLPDGRKVDDLLIFAEGVDIDGAGSVLGQAGPTHLRWSSDLPIAGVMEFDTADLAWMESTGALEDVILHEMGHVLGAGTLWRIKGLLDRSGTDDPVFTGIHASKEFGRIIQGHGEGYPVPVENTGSGGTRESHWRESRFNNELMTGWIDKGRNPLSRLTVASLADLGYEVNLDAADAFSFLSSLRAPGAPGRSCRCARFEPVRLR